MVGPQLGAARDVRCSRTGANSLAAAAGGARSNRLAQRPGQHDREYRAAIGRVHAHHTAVCRRHVPHDEQAQSHAGALGPGVAIGGPPRIRRAVGRSPAYRAQLGDELQRHQDDVEPATQDIARTSKSTLC